MFTVRCWLSISICFLATHACSLRGVAAQKDIVPADFSIVVGHGEGGTIQFDARGRIIGEQIVGWTIKIASDGAATIETRRLRGRPVVRRYTVSRAAVQQVVKAIGDSEFFGLPREMIGTVEHGASYSAEVTMRGRTHKVRVYSPFEFRRQPRLRRFREVWAEAVESCPHVPQTGALAHLDANI